MGRQFSYYAFPDDLAEIERKVFQRVDAKLLIAVKRDSRHHIEAAGAFSLPLEKMGAESLYLLLSPPEQLENMVFSRGWLDVSSSNLIEVGRNYIKDGHISEARFWYEPSMLIEGQRVEKPAPFLAWASEVFRLTKKVLVRHSCVLGNHEYTYWCGKTAKQELLASRVSLR